MPRLLYIGQAPAPGTGSPVILLRHLQRLSAQGWSVSTMCEWGNDLSACRTHGWDNTELIRKQAWWPPLPMRFETCRRIAVRLWARWLCRHVTPRPDAILCYLAWHSDLFAEIAATYGRLAGIPVTCIVHDDATDFTTDHTQVRRLRARQARILRHNHRNWFVSPQQAAAMAPKGAHQGTLTPLPNGESPATRPTWKPEFAKQPVIYYAGYLWPAQAKLIGKIAAMLKGAGAELRVISNLTPEIQALAETGLVTHLPLFKSNQESLQHLRENAAGLIVSYTENSSELPWTRTSMPSKLVEYSFLGLPIILVAPDDTAIMQWAGKLQLRSTFSPAQSEAIASWANALKNQATWQELSAEWLGVSRTDWSPEQIHRQLEEGLARPPRRHGSPR